jgi:hypothetical protein
LVRRGVAASASTGRKINLSVVFAGQSVGIKQVGDEIWLVSFMEYDLGYFDHETCRLEPIEKPFGPKTAAAYPSEIGTVKCHSGMAPPWGPPEFSS